MKFKRVAVLMGGLSKEREVSLASGRAVSLHLKQAGYETVEIDADNNLDTKLRKANVDAVFIALHGRFGEDGTVQGMLEMMQIPYTGSNVLASALAMDKWKTCQLLKNANIPVAPGFLITDKNDTSIPNGFDFPLVVKPSEEGSSVGVNIAKTQEEYESSLKEAFLCSKKILVEQFIEGKEVQIAVLDGKSLGAVEIEPHAEFYDYKSKYEPGGSTHHIPPRIDDKTLEKSMKLGSEVYAQVGCSGAARVDLIVPSSPSKDIIVLEINTIPGMTPTSLLPEIAAHAGLNFKSLVQTLIESAQTHV